MIRKNGRETVHFFEFSFVFDRVKAEKINLLENYRLEDIWQFNSFAYYVRDKAILGEEIYSGIIS